MTKFKIFTIGLFAVFANTSYSFAQWSTSGNNIWNSNVSNVGIGTTNPLDKLQIGAINNAQNLKLSLPGVYNFEQVKLGQYENGAGGLEFINHSNTTSSYGVRFLTNIDNGISGLQIQTANPSNTYQGLNYTTRLAISINGNIGIGTNTPSYPLSFGTNGGATLAFFENLGGVNMTGIRYNASKIGLELIANDGIGIYVANGSNIGIGTNSPSDKLQIGDLNNTQNLKLSLPGVYNFEQVKLGQYGNGAGGLELINHSNSSSSYGVRFLTDIDTGISGLQIQTANPSSTYQGLSYTTRLTVNTNGNVGIGTSNPDQPLTVNGKIHATEVIVDLAVPADYVFHPTYKLMPLHEVEQFVKTNSHLPEIPSAAEVSKNGLNMGEMQNKLLQKIEELTLYMIEQQKEINQLKKRIK